jgi:para-aminobenzoate synthetase/4-amino-4-deoxychorismate lyase
MSAPLAAPFVLLDDASPDGMASRLYRAPRRVIAAATLETVRPALREMRAAVQAGAHAAGFLAYEAGAAIEPRLAALPDGATPLLWFGLFDTVEILAADAVADLLPDPAGAWASAPQPAIDRATYDSHVARVLELIAAGDIYQANLTFAATVRHAGDPLGLYARLRQQARAPYGAVIATGRETILSLSPELFFRLDGGAVLARPMKGTAARGATPADDKIAVAGLSGDAKQRAENLMIVDLLRNDLSRVTKPGSVAAPRLFAVESYPTIHQMVSDVTGRLSDGRDAIDVIEALFPCGSITGAPKIRASQVIADVEERARGIYTGAIGSIAPDGDALFNVAIRTLVMGGENEDEDAQGIATLGLGSGIVADSNADAEWAECLAKGAFVTAGQRSFDLIETMRFDPENGIELLERHLARMKASAFRFGYPFDRHLARNELQAATFRLRDARRVRLVLAPSGAIAIQVGPMPPAPDGPVEVSLVPRTIPASDFRLAHKTSSRIIHDAPRRAAGTFEVAFIDGDGFVTEGSFTTIFVERDGRFVTPPLSRGLLPGVLRAELIETGRAIEGDVTPDDLAAGFFIGNALRGLIPAVAVANERGL